MPSADAFEAALARLETQLPGAAARWTAKASLITKQGQDPGFAFAMIARELELRGTISESCVEWVKHNRWPAMDQDAAMFLWQRVKHAHKFGQWLRQSVGCGGMSEEGALIWLLTDCWSAVCVDLWRWELTNR